MNRYADPRVCPRCRHRLPERALGCPTCGADLATPIAARLFATLGEADRLVQRLTERVAVPAAAVPQDSRAGASAGQPGPVAAPSAATAAPQLAPYPAPVGQHPAAPAGTGMARTGIRAATVPVLLLGLGALCLLTAAITFLALSWDDWGVGARTATLAALTVTAAGCSALLIRRGLRAGAEALTTVTFGLLLLDVVGAHVAGWLGDAGAVVSFGLGGTLVAACGLALTALPLPDRRPLLAPQLASAAGALLAPLALSRALDHWPTAALGTTTLLALAWFARSRGWQVLACGYLAGAAGWWLVLLAAALDELGVEVTLASMWRDGDVVPGLVTVLLAAAPALGWWQRPRIRQSILAAPALLGTYLLLMPALDEGDDRALIALAVAAVTWIAVGLLAGPVRLPATVTALGTVVPLVPVALNLAGVAAERMTTVPWTRTWTFLAGSVSEDPEPLRWALWLPVAVVLAAAALTLLSSWWIEGPRPFRTFLLRHGVTLGIAVAVALVWMLGLLDVPVLIVVGVLLAIALGLLAASLLRVTGTHPEHPALAAAIALLAYAPALVSPGLTALASAAIAAGAALLMVRPPVREARAIGQVLLVVAAAATAWSLGEAVGVAPQWRTLVILVALGALTVLLPRLVLEATAVAMALVALTAGLVGLERTGEPVSTWLSAYLTVAAIACFVSALMHAKRRLLVWPGAVLLMVASWVQLFRWGATVEAYTVPAAVLVLMLGLHQMRRHPGLSSAAALTPGLLLGLLPSLFLAAGDAVSLRGLLLGLTALGLVLAGTRLHWSSPLLAGVVTGTLIALMAVGPYAALVPSWVWIGGSGVALLALGVTWEARLRNVRTSAAYLGRLR